MPSSISHRDSKYKWKKDKRKKIYHHEQNNILRWLFYFSLTEASIKQMKNKKIK